MAAKPPFHSHDAQLQGRSAALFQQTAWRRRCLRTSALRAGPRARSGPRPTCVRKTRGATSTRCSRATPSPRCDHGVQGGRQRWRAFLSARSGMQVLPKRGSRRVFVLAAGGRALLRAGGPRRAHSLLALPMSTVTPAQVDPPRGWEWESGWQLDHGPSTDADGWAYAPGAQAIAQGLRPAIRIAAWDLSNQRGRQAPCFPEAAANRLCGRLPCLLCRL